MLRRSARRLSAQKLLVKQRMREREGKEFIPGRVIWDECTRSGPANWPIEPPAPMKGPLGWRLFFHERELFKSNKDFDTALFAYRVHAAMQEEFSKVEHHPPPVPDHHTPGGKLLLVYQNIDSERQVQTSSSIPKDKYEMQRYVDDILKEKASEKYSVQMNYAWQKEQEEQFCNHRAGIMTEDARVWDNIMTEDEYAKHLGGRIAQAFIFGWITLVVLSLIWRIK
eukprot:TRINITY_DN17845_c0_g3_i1.p1 TRINITY_DN17845_c0_g3~~TRINITY_DN17845_c0_g3_i1.p1  ORF type:complete len:246 (+),score=91.17 TRINITY_DN17845_c0_g3_i1:65-739(+)